jgi:hypothetical protein
MIDRELGVLRKILLLHGEVLYDGDEPVSVKDNICRNWKVSLTDNKNF